MGVSVEKEKSSEQPAVGPAGPCEARRPSWMTREELAQLAPEARREVEETIVPAYQELVLEAATALERAGAEQLVHLWWLELLQAFRLSALRAKPPSDSPVPDDIYQMRVDRQTERYLTVAREKLRVANFLLRLKEARERLRLKAENAAIAAAHAALKLAPLNARPAPGFDAHASRPANPAPEPDSRLPKAAQRAEPLGVSAAHPAAWPAPQPGFPHGNGQPLHKDSEHDGAEHDGPEHGEFGKTRFG